MYKLLVVSPFFWPFAGVGAERIGSLVNYLSENKEFDITVVKNSNISYKDHILDDVKILDGVKVLNINVNDNFFRNYSLYKKCMKDLIKQANYDCVLISVGPYYTLPLISYIKRIKHNLPTILDIRDFWVYEGSFLEDKSVFMTIKSKIKDSIFQKKAIVNSDVITVTGDGGKTIIKERYGEIYSHKVFSILNGFDDGRIFIDNNRKSIWGDKFSICIFGKFAEYLSDKQLKEISDGLRELGNESLKIIQVGNKEKRLEEYLSLNNVDYFNTGYLKYEDGIAYLNKYASAFFLSNDLILGNGTKVYDYIFCDRPIIYYGIKNSGLCKFLDNFQNAFICDNKNELVNSISKIRSEKIAALDPKKERKWDYSRKKQNAKFMRLIEKICAEGSSW